MHIRTATMDDAPALVAYADQLFGEHLPGIFDRAVPTLEEERTYVASYLDRENSTMLIAEEDGRVVGMIAFSGGTLAEERHLGEFGLSVARDTRGRGVGSALLEALVEWAPGAGIERIEAATWSSNPGAQALYERHGFVVDGVKRRAIKRGGEYFDVINMALLL